jgi:Na+/melibiose symporter-like transporter
MIVGFIVWELRQRDPMVPLDFFKNRVFSISNTVVLMVGFAMFGVIYFITLYFQNVQGYSPMQAGVRSLPLTMMVIIVAPIAGRLNTKIGPRPLMSAGMLMMTIGLLGLSRLQVDTSYWAIWPFYVLMGAGISMTMPSVSSAAMGAVDPTKAGVASGVVNSSRQVGGALGIAILGSVGAALTVSQWEDKVGQIGAPAAAKSDSAEQLVIGGQGDLVGHVVSQAAGSSAGEAARTAALEAFVHGVQGAMLVGAVLAFAACLTSFFGLRGTRAAEAPPQPQGERAPTAAVEM